MKIKSKNFWVLVMIVLIVAFDRITKILAKSYLFPDKAKTLIKGFLEFRYAENTGAAFSMLSGGRWLLIVFTVISLAVCFCYMFSKKGQSDLWLFWTLGVFISGGIGNLIDRVFLGYVIDFINPLFVDFAIFNIADCAVTLSGVSFVAYIVFISFKKEKKSDE